MKTIHDFFDRVYLLSLPERADRRIAIASELTKSGLSDRVQTYTPIAHETPRISFSLSFIAMFRDALKDGCESLLVIEDDCVFDDAFPVYATAAVRELPRQWDCVYFGGNLFRFPVRNFSMHLARAGGVWTTHCVGFSAKCMRFCVDRYNAERMMIFDDWLRLNVHPRGSTYITKRLLAKQRPGFSDINQADVDYWQAWDVTEKKLGRI